jgi:hypothetical protein
MMNDERPSQGMVTGVYAWTAVEFVLYGSVFVGLAFASRPAD